MPQIAHNVRVGKKVRPEVIATLGWLDPLRQSYQLERLMRSGLRHCAGVAVPGRPRGWLDGAGVGRTHRVRPPELLRPLRVPSLRRVIC